MWWSDCIDKPITLELDYEGLLEKVKWVERLGLSGIEVNDEIYDSIIEKLILIKIA